MIKNILPFAIFIFLVSSAFISADITSISIGTEMPKPDAKMKDVISGKEITLKEQAKENGLLVIFSCNTCPFVVKQEKTILGSAKLATGNKIGIVVINSNEARRDKDDSEAAMKDYAKKQGFKFPYTMDSNSEVADAFGATRTPEIFLFDKNFKLAYKGALADDTEPANAKVFYLNDAISAMVSGRAINPDATKSVGCTIKRK